MQPDAPKSSDGSTQQLADPGALYPAEALTASSWMLPVTSAIRIGGKSQHSGSWDCATVHYAKGGAEADPLGRRYGETPIWWHSEALKGTHIGPG